MVFQLQDAHTIAITIAMTNVMSVTGGGAERSGSGITNSFTGTGGGNGERAGTATGRGGQGRGRRTAVLLVGQTGRVQ